MQKSICTNQCEISLSICPCFLSRVVINKHKRDALKSAALTRSRFFYSVFYILRNAELRQAELFRERLCRGENVVAVGIVHGNFFAA